MAPSSEESALGLPFGIAAFDRAGSGRDERRLLRELRGGAAEAVEELFRRHWDGVHRAAYLIVRDEAAAEDIAQESMLAAIRAIDSFDRRRPLRPWLHRITVNRSLDWLRQAKRRRETELASAPLARDQAGEVPSGYGLSESLLDAFARLTPEERAAIVMRHLLGYSPKEIARIIDEPAGTVRARISRGLVALREALEGQIGGNDV